MKKKVIDFLSKKNYLILILFAILFELLIYLFQSYISYHFIFILTLVFIYIFSLFLILCNKKDLKDNLLYLIFLLGIILRTIYIFKTTIYERQMDVLDIFDNGHLGYIYTLYKTHHLPLTNDWQFYHPPLWHILGALWLHINNLFNVELSISLEGLQILTLLFSSFIILIVDKICIKLELNNKYRYLIDLLFAIHPTLIRFSGSINNDCLLLFLECLVLLLLMNFDDNSNWKNTIYLAIVTGLCVMTKMNGAVMAIPILYVFINKFVHMIKHKSNNIKSFIYKIIVFSFISLPIGLWFQVRNLILFSKSQVPRPADWLSSGEHSIFERFISINFHEMFNYANMNSDYNFSSFIVKSSLFGEFIYNNILILKYILIVLNIILIVISLVFIFKYIIEDRKNIIINILVITWLSFMISMYLFNLDYAYTCSMDFRYIAICLLPGILIIGYELKNIKNKKLCVFIQIVCYLFLVANIIFTYIF